MSLESLRGPRRQCGGVSLPTFRVPLMVVAGHGMVLFEGGKVPLRDPLPCAVRFREFPLPWQATGGCLLDLADSPRFQVVFYRPHHPDFQPKPEQKKRRK